MKISLRPFLLALTGAALLIAAIAGFIVSHPPDAPEAANPDRPQAESLPPGTETMTPEQRDQWLVDRMVRELQQRYAATIARIGTQVRLLEVKHQILAMFPEDGAARFLQILKRAFPEHADQVMATLNRLERYQRWLADNEGRLARMSDFERKAALWEKQRELFGEDADEIWSGELLAAEARTAVMQDTMAELGASYDQSIEEKLDAFQDTLRQTYEDSPDAHVLHERFMLAKAFFSLESVQSELQAMPAEDRQSKMNQVRRQMGFSEEEIEQMQLVDEARDQQWETGLNYMQEREQVAFGYEGEEQQHRLESLRQKYFKEEAGTIRLEEEEGFFRFERPRVYGRN